MLLSRAFDSQAMLSPILDTAQIIMLIRRHFPWPFAVSVLLLDFLRARLFPKTYSLNLKRLTNKREWYDKRSSSSRLRLTEY